MNVRYTVRAIRDLGTILDYISSRSAVGGANVKRAIYRTIALIGEHPLAGRKMPATETRKLRAGRYPT